MIKTILVNGFILALVLVCLFMCGQAQKAPITLEEHLKIENSIDIVTSAGQCWVVERAPNNLVLQSMYTADDLDNCINWLRDYHHGSN